MHSRPLSSAALLRRGTAGAALVALTMLAATGLLATGALPAAAAPPPLSADSPLSPELATVAVDGPRWRAALAAYEQTNARLTETRRILAESENELVRLASEDLRLTEAIAADAARKKQALVDLSSARAALRGVAVAIYIEGGRAQPMADDLDTAAATAQLGNIALARSVEQSQRVRRDIADEALVAARRSLVDHLDERDEVRRRIDEVRQQRDRAAADEVQLAGELAARYVEVERARLTATVAGADFSLVALDAYVRAAQATALDRPACGIQWYALAGISRTEGRHGTFGGAQLLEDGRVSKPIIGIALDGNNDTALIGDSDGGVLDGDAIYDRAVGPMQFIPGTWRRWGRDGNSDGEVDPQNLYDAARAAALYLCAGGPMVTDEDLLRGFYSYNHSIVYAQGVLANSRRYQQLPFAPLLLV